VQQRLADGTLGAWLLERHPEAHGLRTDKLLYGFVQDIKNSCLRGSDPLARVMFDSKLQVVAHALGTHITVARVQGSRLKTKREIRIAALFKDTPLAFLRMIAVHELAHFKERAHDRAFYQLCTYMEPEYHQLEFELRVYLTLLQFTGQRLWSSSEAADQRPALQPPARLTE
jgi:predicted metal-dependent hydrolase